MLVWVLDFMDGVEEAIFVDSIVGCGDDSLVVAQPCRINSTAPINKMSSLYKNDFGMYA